MKLIYKYFFAGLFVLFLCINNGVVAETYATKTGFSTDSVNKFTCAVDQNNQKYWFAVLVQHPFTIPILYPEEQTIIFCYDMRTNTLLRKYTCNQRIYEMIPFENGIVFSRDHYFFLDLQICYYDEILSKMLVFQRPTLVGKIVAINNNILYYQGTSAYDDTNIYAYNIKTQEVRLICKDVGDTYADGQQIYVVTKSKKNRINIYDIHNGELSSNSVQLDSNSKIISVADHKAVTSDGSLFMFEDYEATVIQSRFNLEKEVNACWLEDDRLIIISGDVLESYIISNSQIERVFDYRFGESVCAIQALYNQIFLFDQTDASLYILNVDGKNELHISLR